MLTRIFRAPTARYYADDVLEGPAIYTDASLEQLCAHGFTGIWLPPISRVIPVRRTGKLFARLSVVAL